MGIGSQGRVSGDAVQGAVRRGEGLLPILQNNCTTAAPRSQRENGGVRAWAGVVSVPRDALRPRGLQR